MRLSTSVVLIALAWPVAGLAQTVTLQNDSFNPGDLVHYQGGFVAGEMGASRFIPTGAALYRLTKVRFFYGPSGITNQIDLHVYDDSGLTDTPGTELFTSSYQVDGTAVAFVEIDLSADHVDVPGPFRVAIEFSAAGDPSIASDADGTIAADKNFIFASGLAWSKSATLGLTGDWIIRADVEQQAVDGGPPDAGPDAGVGTDAGPDAGMVDAGVGTDAGGGATCKVTSECPTGQYCLNKTSCTYDCRIDADCGANMRCTSSGQCEATPAASSGCSQGAGDGTVASALGVLGGLAILWRSRRRRG